MDMAYRYITLRREGHAWHLTFNRPERRNALNHTMMKEIGHAIDRVAPNRAVDRAVEWPARALVLRGNEGAFCAGGDLGSMSDMPKKPAKRADPLAKVYREYGALFEKLNRLPLAVISVVEGPAVGGGLAMVCCSDVVIIHRSAKFGIPEPRSGFIPSQVLPFLFRRLGEGTTRYLAVTGAIMDAATAHRAGLGMSLCATRPALERALESVLRDIGRMEPDALATVKRLALSCATDDHARVLDRGSVELARLLRRPEALAGMEAFLKKKPPPWAGP